MPISRLAREENRRGGVLPGVSSPVLALRAYRQSVWIENRGGHMSTSVLYMSMSLDGYIAGPNDDPSNPGGDNFDRLHEWFGATLDGEAGQLQNEYKETGAVLVGRRTAEQVDHYG